jgi:hypothetical protein
MRAQQAAPTPSDVSKRGIATTYTGVKWVREMTKLASACAKSPSVTSLSIGGAAPSATIS